MTAIAEALVSDVGLRNLPWQIEAAVEHATATDDLTGYWKRIFEANSGKPMPIVRGLPVEPISADGDRNSALFPYRLVDLSRCAAWLGTQVEAAEPESAAGAEEIEIESE